MDRPFIHINAALRDGPETGLPAAFSGEISCAADWARVHLLREKYDGVAVGGRTWNQDRPRLNVRADRLGRDPSRQPARVIFAGRTLCVPPLPGAPAFLVGASAATAPGLTHVPLTGHDLRPALAALHAHGIASLLVEGGPTLLQGFLAQGLFDHISLFIRAADAAAALACARRHLPGLPADLSPRPFGAGFLLEATRKAVSPPPVRFVLFAAPRTGSNLLCGLLNAHPDILCHHGLFNPGGIHWARAGLPMADYPGGVGCRDADPAAFLRHVWSQQVGQSATGFKLNRDEDEGAVSLLLRDRGVRKILLRRRNRVRTYVSEQVARQTGIWESYEEGASASPLPRLRLDPADLRQHAALNAAYYAQLEAVMRADGQGWLDTCYEDLAQPGELARILAFLGQPLPARLPSICHKRGPADLGAVVQNLDALRQALAGTDLADDLHGPDVPDLKFHAFMPEETLPCPMPASPPVLIPSPAIVAR